MKRTTTLLCAATLVALFTGLARADRRAPNQPPRRRTAGPQIQFRATSSSRMRIAIARADLQKLLAAGGVKLGPDRRAGADDAPRLGAMETVMVGLALSGAIALFGLWLVRRRKQPSPEADDTRRSRGGGVLLLLVFGAGLAVSLLSVSNAWSDLPVPPRAVRSFNVVRSSNRFVNIVAPAYKVCPLVAAPRPRPPG
ncbi:MAG: hypothetical protein KC503_33675 [Myxococcales bacterium]|nr:hypothetical protein [Myxococcales bacterium]